MEQAVYLVRGRRYAGEDPALQDALARIHGSSERPRCMCVPGGVEMYVAKLAHYIVKRMPETGGRHHPSCQSFEPEPARSGLGDLMGKSIVEHTPAQLEVRTDFPMARMSGRAIPRGPNRGSPSEVQTEVKGMSLRALLHFLYERAGFNRWYPAMHGKRSHGVLHKYLMLASTGIRLNGAALEERLYVPEPFRLDRKEDVAEWRRRKLSILVSSADSNRRKLAIVVGEFGGAEQTGSGHVIRIKHMADVPLHLDSKTWERAVRKHAEIFEAIHSDVAHKPRVLMALLIGAKSERRYEVDTLTCMLVSDQWVPLAGLYELPLIEALQQQGRRFVKPLRYDLKSVADLASVLLLDCVGAPLAMHVISAFLDPRDKAAKEHAVAKLGNGCWVWRNELAMPELPPASTDRAVHVDANRDRELEISI